MQPRTLTLLLIVLPIVTVNGVYLMSAAEGLVPWCIPYVDGCTTISRAARSGDAIFLFRVTMIAYAVLLIWFWIYVKRWLGVLGAGETRVASLIPWLGVAGALAMMVYVDFLGAEGEFNRFMRRHGIMLFFLFTPMAQLLLHREQQKLLNTGDTTAVRALRWQLIVLLLMLALGMSGLLIDLAGKKSYESQNIVEWNFTLLTNLYFLGTLSIWREFRVHFSR